jgi:hypothetical protein
MGLFVISALKETTQFILKAKKIGVITNPMHSYHKVHSDRLTIKKPGTMPGLPYHLGFLSSPTF